MRVTELETHDDLAAVATLLAGIWGRPSDAPPVSSEMLRSLTHSGNYVAGAFVDGELVGASVGVLGLARGALHLHSFITGISPRHQGRRVGFELKQHQRRWATERAIPAIAWTYDPLLRRNAFFNLTKLGADVVAYRTRFYGPMEDRFNAGDESDRAVVRWELDSPRARLAAEGRPEEPDVAALRAAGAAVVLDDGPTVGPSDGADVLLAWIPSDVVALRRGDPERALAWRRAARRSFGAAVDEGYVGRAMTRTGWYVLSRTGLGGATGGEAGRGGAGPGGAGPGGAR